MTQPDKLTIEEVDTLIRNIEARRSPATIERQLLETMHENERLRKAMQTIPRNSLSCHIETHLNDALACNKPSSQYQGNCQECGGYLPVHYGFCTKT